MQCSYGTKVPLHRSLYAEMKQQIKAFKWHSANVFVMSGGKKLNVLVSVRSTKSLITRNMKERQHQSQSLISINSLKI